MANKVDKAKRLESVAVRAVAGVGTRPPGMSAAEAVRQAIAAGRVSPSDGTDFLMSMYGIEMANQTFSTYKSQQKLRDARKSLRGKPGRKPKSASQAGVGDSIRLPKPVESTDDSGLIEALEAMKPMVASLGADKVKRLVDLLG